MKKKSWCMVTSGAFVLSLVACDMKKQMSEMHDSTVEMNQTTKKMATTTEEMKDITSGMSKTTEAMKSITESMSKTTVNMSKTTEGMNGTTQDMSIVTSELYDAAKIGGMSSQRREALHELRTAESSGRKITEATKYFISFEYQLYSGFGQDRSEDKRNLLIHEATLEFFKDINEFLTNEIELQPLAQSKEGVDENKEACFNAIAAAMHRVNRKQDEYIVKNRLTENDSISMLKIIVSALEKKEAIDKGEVKLNDLPEYVRVVLVHEEVAIKLLQARHNFISAVLLSEISEIKKGKLTAYAMALKNWDVNSEKFNLAQSEEYLKYINSVMSTHDILKKLNQIPKINSKLVKLFNNAVWVDSKNNSNVALSTSLKSLKEAFAKFMQTIRIMPSI